MQRGIRQVLVLPEIILNMEHDIRRSKETQDIQKNVQRKAADRRASFEKVLQNWSCTLQKKTDIISMRPNLAANRELRKAEYLRLLYAAKKDQRLCAQANVNPDKVFPHNLRKLFVRTFYRMEKDIAKLADILGHSSINTTRIYIMSTGTE